MGGTVLAGGGEFGGSNFMALGGGLQTESLVELLPIFAENRINQQ